MNPEARRDVEVEQEAVSPFAWAVWDECDGRRSVPELTELLSATDRRPIPVEAVFAALDELADNGLLVERVTPPGTRSLVSRRDVLKAGLAGAGLVVAGATPAAAAASRRKRKDPAEDNKKARKGNRENNQKARNNRREDTRKARKGQLDKNAAEESKKDNRNDSEDQNKSNRASKENNRKAANP